MNLLHSFRWRILLGTVLWTLGLIPLIHLLFLVVHRQLRFMAGWAIGIFLFLRLCAYWEEFGNFAPDCCPSAVCVDNYRVCVMVPATGSKEHIQPKCSHW